jgi:hypothetical protein
MKLNTRYASTQYECRSRCRSRRVGRTLHRTESIPSFSSVHELVNLFKPCSPSEPGEERRGLAKEYKSLTHEKHHSQTKICLASTLRSTSLSKPPNPNHQRLHKEHQCLLFNMFRMLLGLLVVCIGPTNSGSSLPIYGRCQCTE